MPTSASVKKAFGFETLTAQIADYRQKYADDISKKMYFGFPMASILKDENRLLDPATQSVAYFSMEYGLAPSIYNSFSLSRPISKKNQFFRHEVFSNYWLVDYMFQIQIDKLLDIPIYSGGLGVLAGDTVKSAADVGVSFVALGILWNKGYFKQNFWYKHGQVPEELEWDPHTYPGLVPLNKTVTLQTKDGPLHLRLWKYYVYSHDRKQVCPLVLLDSNVEENPEHFRRLTDQLYRSDDVWWKIFQRAILGIGGMKALTELGYQVDRYHLNEGHAAFALLEKYVQLEDKSLMDQERERFLFTCHTPVEAGHDRFMMHDVAKILPDAYIEAAEDFGKEKPDSDQINLTYMCLNNASRMNAVAQKHGDVMRIQFPAFADKIQAITNGIHSHTWVSEAMSRVFDSYKDRIGDWRADPACLSRVNELKGDMDFRRAVIEAHQQNKRNMIGVMKHWGLDENALTVSWARRIASYKRPALIFYDIDRLVELARRYGRIQILFAGKAHPNDNIGGAHIDRILDHVNELNKHKDLLRVLILENYDTYFGKLLTNSVDVWLNNPLPPFEASGTSGMKAIINGVLQCSTLDGWVVEAEQDDIGWIFGYRHSGKELGTEGNARMSEDSDALYQTMEQILQMYFAMNRQGDIDLSSPWIDKMINCIACSAFFNTQRMAQEYQQKMWKLG
ncbi:MAG: alpha-glucan family phosphorylase [Candidatus Omnitrophota bacterium]